MQGQITLPTFDRPFSEPKLPEETSFRANPELLEKAKLARAAAKARRDASPLRRDFADAYEWDELARRFAIRLPPWGDPPTPSIMRGFLKRSRIAIADYLAQFGEKNLTEFAKANPTWPARAWAGLVLEWKEAGGR